MAGPSSRRAASTKTRSARSSRSSSRQRRTPDGFQAATVSGDNNNNNNNNDKEQQQQHQQHHHHHRRGGSSTQRCAAKKWAQVRRPPAPGIGFTVSLWVPLDSITPQERERLFPVTTPLEESTLVSGATTTTTISNPTTTRPSMPLELGVLPSYAASAATQECGEGSRGVTFAVPISTSAAERFLSSSIDPETMTAISIALDHSAAAAAASSVADELVIAAAAAASSVADELVIAAADSDGTCAPPAKRQRLRNEDTSTTMEDIPPELEEATVTSTNEDELDIAMKNERVEQNDAQPDVMFYDPSHATTTTPTSTIGTEMMRNASTLEETATEPNNQAITEKDASEMGP
jgi:hypothetical protein